MAETESDVSADTARFRAFKERSDDLPPPWQMRAPGSRIGMLAVIVIVVAILAAIIGSLLVG
jgi:hypothetical protein